jgi:hypothetical protein
MNPLQQMDLARFDHQERLQQAQHNRLARQISRKPLFSFLLFSHKRASADKVKPVTIKCDTVAVN